MMDEKILMELIIHGGNAHSLAMEAISKAKEYEFSDAEKMLAEAKEEELNAHKAQTKIIQSACYDVKEKLTNEMVSILSVHAFDHVFGGQLAIELAEETIDTYKKIQELEGKTDV